LNLGIFDGLKFANDSIVVINVLTRWITLEIDEIGEYRCRRQPSA